MKLYNLLILTIPVVVLLSACANSPPKPTIKTIYTTNIFNEEEFKTKIAQNGTNIIKGVSYATNIYTDTYGSMQVVESAACTEATLIPVMPYSTERVESIYGNITEMYKPLSGLVLKFSPENPSYSINARKVQCSADGSFLFDRLSEGEYYIITVIVKKIGDNLWRGGTAFKKVHVSAGKTVEIFLSNQLTRNLKALKYGNSPSNYKNTFKKIVTATLKDPSSGQFKNIQKPKKFWMVKDSKSYRDNKLPVETAAPFWIVCGEVNAKNSFGGFTGFGIVAILYSPDGSITLAPLDEDNRVSYPYFASEENPCGNSSLNL